MRLLASALALVVVGCAARSPRIALTDGPPRGFAVLGLEAEELAKLRGDALDDDEWRRVFRVSLSTLGLDDLPAVAGSYSLEGGAVVFHPLFEPAPGTAYDVRFDAAGESLRARVAVPASAPRPESEVVRVDPHCGVLVENQLKLYLHFSRPMRRHGSYGFIRLVDLGPGGGAEPRVVEDPFLELSEELWNAEGTRLTVFFDPGRVKRLLRPHEELGPPLVEGHVYELRIDAAWPDANGAPLVDGFTARFRVGPPDYDSPDIDAWTISSPGAGTRDAIEVAFGESLERALVERLIWVERDGAELMGEVAVSNCDRTWRFVPDAPWRGAGAELVVRTTLEDLAGNSIASPFEVHLFQQAKPRVENRTVRRAIPLAR